MWGTGDICNIFNDKVFFFQKIKLNATDPSKCSSVRIEEVDSELYLILRSFIYYLMR